MAEAVEDLKSSKIIGFDTETRPSFFSRGKQNKICLIQLSSSTHVYLFRLNILKRCPQGIIDIMRSEEILKVGFSLGGDFSGLRKIGIKETKNFVDVQTFVEKKKFQKGMGLLRVYGACFELRLDKTKSVTCSDWEAPTLSERQINYAALDAEACVQIYNYITSPDFSPEKSHYLRVVNVPDKRKVLDKGKRRNR